MCSMLSCQSNLECLPNEIQRLILKYLTLYDCYYSFFNLNHSYNCLIKQITPVRINRKCLDNDIDQSGILISDYWVWNDRFVYCLIPIFQSNSIHWLFLSSDSIGKYKSQFDKCVVDIINKYKVESNAPGLLVTKANYYFCSTSSDLNRLERWIKDNYLQQYEIIQNFGPRRHLPKRIDHYDGKYFEIKQALADVQRLERLKRKNIIYERAQYIWNELRQLKNFNLLDLIFQDCI